jgi:toxin FitB
VIILDTNVISEVMLDRPEPTVLAWLDGLPDQSVWITSITVFEIRHGLEIMSAGRRRRALEKAFSEIIEGDLESRVLPLETDAAEAAGALSAERRRAGRSIEIRDALIAGIARARKATLATRNVRHFRGIALKVVDPWSA